MKRHPIRKQITAHERGEHGGLNLFYRRCPLCQADVAEVWRQHEEAIAEVKALIGSPVGGTLTEGQEDGG